MTGGISNYDYDEIITGNITCASGSIVEDEILMPQYAKGQIPCLIGVEVLHPALCEVDNKYSRFSLTTKEEGTSALPNLDASEVITKQERHIGFTTSGEALEDTVQMVDFPAPIPITSPKLYMQFNQDSGSSHDYRYRLHVAPRFIRGLMQRTTQNVAQF